MTAFQNVKNNSKGKTFFTTAFQNVKMPYQIVKMTKNKYLCSAIF
jgi:hypothetical protein